MPDEANETLRLLREMDRKLTRAVTQVETILTQQDAHGTKIDQAHSKAFEARNALAIEVARREALEDRVRSAERRVDKLAWTLATTILGALGAILAMLLPRLLG